MVAQLQYVYTAESGEDFRVTFERRTDGPGCWRRIERERDGDWQVVGREPVRDVSVESATVRPDA